MRGEMESGMKTAFLFSGQGAQYPGMGKDLYENYDSAKAVFDSIATDFDVKTLCFEGSKEQLDDTQYTQVAIFAHAMAAAAVLQENGIHADVTAGLSLGEYSALCYADCFSVQAGAEILRERGKLMANALPSGTSAMAAVLMLDKEAILNACEAVQDIGVCEIANYNCPGQIVISGKKAAVEEACEKLKAAGAKRAIMLNVSGPFHSGMLVGAGEKLGKVLENVEIHKPVIPYAANVTAQYVTEAEPVKDLLVKQVSSSVKWQQCVETMLADGVDTFIEIGPGKTLAGFMRKIDRSVKTLNVEKLEDIEKVVEALKEA